MISKLSELEGKCIEMKGIVYACTIPKSRHLNIISRASGDAYQLSSKQVKFDKQTGEIYIQMNGITSRALVVDYVSPTKEVSDTKRCLIWLHCVGNLTIIEKTIPEVTVLDHSGNKLLLETVLHTKIGSTSKEQSIFSRIAGAIVFSNKDDDSIVTSILSSPNLRPSLVSLQGIFSFAHNTIKIGVYPM